jgi:cytochrome c553
MKNILVAIFSIIIISLMINTYTSGKAYHGGNHNKVIQDIKDIKEINTPKTVVQKQRIIKTNKQRKNKEADKIQILRQKAGNAGAFKVSHMYKSKCSPCHGVNGSGFQNGRAMMGPKLIDQSADKIYKDLIDFKAGRKQNLIMKGLLIKLDKNDLKKLADEIGKFPTKQKELKNK